MNRNRLHSPISLTSLALLAAASPVLAQGSCSWEVVNPPLDSTWTRAEFEDVSVLPDGTAWAVGYAQRNSPIGLEELTLAMRYSNGQWQHTPTPYVAPSPGLAADFLHAVEALAPDDVWAAGERWGDAGGVSNGAWLHVVHWDGSSWSEVPVPAPPGGAGINFSGPRVYDIAAFASDDVWFGGLWGEPNPQFTVTWRPLAMHWDGSGMTLYPTPVLFSGTDPMHMRQLAAVAPNDIWGICRTNTAGGATDNPTVLHYDGSSWSQVSAPSLQSQVTLDDIVAVSANEVWIFGHTYPIPTPFALRWNGSSFSVVNGVPQAQTIGAEGPSKIHIGRLDLKLFDGANTTVLDTLPSVNSPQLLGMEMHSGCSGWAVGRFWNSPLVTFSPLAVRRNSACSVASYCTAGTSANACQALLSSTGFADAGAGAGFVVTASSVEGQKQGLLFYGLSGAAALPWGVGGTSYLCVSPPTQRTPVQSSGGTLGACDGSLSIDWNAFISSNLGALGNPFAGGETVWMQAWYRDPPSVKTTSLSDALRFGVCP